MTPHLLRHRLSRAALLRGTALQAAFALTIVPAHAQPAPNARPQGGQVVAGAATIARAPTKTVVSQSTDRAAIDWRSFDVGKNQTVTFQQPSVTSATLNRVTGPDPSAIAGRITANGQLILTNPNGVTFSQGAQVNAQSLIVSAPGITNQNFMAGRMVFDQAAKPGARIENAGTITVKQAGLAALVAPSVANSGTINARLGHVVLAGAATHTLDMYGDGLVSIDVTKQVVQTPTGPGGKPVTALVTNTGTIRADGGTIQLTARAADGVVQTLVDAGGTLRANTVGARTGQIEIAGTGGAVIIAGRIATNSRTGQAGTIVLNGSTETTLADGAHVTANGGTGGGTIAVGTTLARARTTGPAPAATSARTTIAAGARLAANATGAGNGGRITVLSTQSTSVAGTLAAKGGAQSGDGGTIELSGNTDFHLTGTVDTGSPHGAIGTVILDPRDLYVTDNPPEGTQVAPVVDNNDPNIAANAGGTTTDASISPDRLENIVGNVHILTTRDLIVDSAVVKGSDSFSLTLEAGRNLTVTSSINEGSGNLLLKAGSSAVSGYDPTGALSITAAITGQTIGLSAGTGGIALSANVNASTALAISTPGALTQTAGIVTTPQMYGTAGSVNLPTANAIAGIGNGQNASFQTTTGGILLTNAANQPLTIGNNQGGGGLFVPTGQTVSLTVDALTLAAAANGTAISAPNGTIALQPATASRSILVSATNNSETGALQLDPANLGLLKTGTLQLGTTTNSGGITLGSGNETVNLSAPGIGALALVTAGDIIQGGPLTVASLSVRAGINSGVTLTNSANQIGALSSLSGNDNISIATAGALLLGTVGVDAATIIAGGNITQSATSSLTASDSLTLSAGDPSIAGFNPAAAITLAGRVRPANTLSLSAGTGGIALTGSVFATDVTVSTTGPLTQGTTPITATDLSGSASTVNLPAANMIVGISHFEVTGSGIADYGSSFTLANAAALSVGTTSTNGITTGPNGEINLATDALNLAARGGSSALSTGGGSLVIQPYNANTPLLLTAAEVALIGTGQLNLGGTNPATGRATTGAITLGNAQESIDLGSRGTSSLTLNTTGAVTQGGPLTVNFLSALAGSVALANAGNQIPVVAASATGDIALHTSGNLSIIVANAGGNLSLSSSGAGGMNLGGNLSGQTVTLNSLSTNATTPTTSDPGITETSDGTITATTLTGAAGSAQFGNANAVANLGTFATYSGLQLNDGTTPLAITGAVSSTTGAISLTAAGITQTAAASLTTPEFDGSSTAATTLTARGNAVQAIGAFTQTTGDFTLATSAPTLAVNQIAANNGSLSFIADGIAVPASERTSPAISAPAGSVTVAPYTAGRRIELIGDGAADPNSLSLGAGVTSRISAQRLIFNTTGPIAIGNGDDTIDLRSVTGTLQLQTTAAVTQGANSSLLVGTLTGTAGSLNLASATNAVPVVNAFTATGGDLALRTAGSLAVNGTTASGALSFTAGGDLSATGTLSAGTTATLTAIGTVTLSGAVQAADIAITGSTGITQSAGTLAATGGVTLTAPGRSISQAGGTITAAALTTNSAILSLPGANTVATATLTATSAATLNDAAILNLAGLSTIDGTITSAGDLTLTGRIAATGTLALRAGGVISQPGGTLATGTLTAAATQITLAQPNAIATLAAASSTGGLTVTDAGALTVTGPLSDPTGITLRTGGDLALAGPITTGALTVTASGAITQPGGTITAASLSGTAGSATLTQPNAITTLAGFTTSGNFTLADHTPLTVSGPVTAGTGQTIALAANALTLDGTLTAPAGTVSFAAYDASAGLTLAGNAAVAAAAVTVGSATAGPVGITGIFGFANASLDLRSAGAITETTTASLTAGTLTGQAASAALPGPNRIATLGRFDTTGSFALTDAAPLTVAGPVTAGTGQTVALTTANLVFAPGGTLTAPDGTVSLAEYTAGQGITLGGSGIPFSASTLVVGSATAGPIAITGAFDLTGLTLDLESIGAITETGNGAIKAAALTGHAASVSLTGLNQIGSLGRFTTTGDLTLANAADLAMTGPVTAATATLSSTGNLTLAGTLTTTSSLRLTASGAITQPGGTITAASLSGTAASATLTQPNAITTLAGFTTINSFGLVDRTPLTLAGPVSAGPGQIIALRTNALTFASGASLSVPSGTVTLTEFVTGQGITVGGGTIALGAGTLSIGTATGGPIAITGLLDVGTATLDLESAGAITETSAATLTDRAGIATLGLTSASAIIDTSVGAIRAATLTGRADTATLTGPNQIGSLGRFAINGDLALANAADLAVTGPLTAANLALSTTGNLTLSGTVATPGTLALTAGGAITQPGGSLTATILTGSAASTTLDQPANAIATLSNFTAAGRLGLATAGNLTFANTVAGSQIDLAVGGGIAQAAASRLMTGRLSGNASSAALGGANQVDTVAFATDGGFALTDARALTVTGPLTDQGAGIAIAAPSITLAGPVAAPSLTVTSPGAVTQTAGALTIGALTIGTLSGTAGSIDIGNQAPANIGALGPLAASSAIALTDQAPLRITGPLASPTLAIAATGALVLDGGTIRTDGQPFAAQLGTTPAPGGSTLAVRRDANGNASLTQRGTTTLTSYAGGTATLRLDLQSGTLALNDFEAPGGNLVLSLGSGTATGSLRAGQLAILGAGGSAALTGQIGTRSDNTAAQIGQLLPGTDLRYTFNSCAIAAAACSSEAIGSVFLPAAAIVSILRPDILTLGILDLTVTRDRDDPTLLLPNISDRDY